MLFKDVILTLLWGARKLNACKNHSYTVLPDSVYFVSSVPGALSDQSLQDIASKLKYNNYVWVCQHLGYMKHEVDTLTQHLPHDPHIRGMHVLGHWRDTYTRGDKVTCLSKALRKCRFHSLANDLVDRQRAMPLCTAV